MCAVYCMGRLCVCEREAVAMLCCRARRYMCACGVCRVSCVCVVCVCGCGCGCVWVCVW